MVNYPHQLRRQKLETKVAKANLTNFANRGMSFEASINATNDYYLAHHIAVIHKKPTPVQIVKVDYPRRSRAKIVEAYFRQASTTDYSGVYKGLYLDFEAKETRHKTSMPMKNFHSHQIEHMRQVLEQDGICFVLLHFSTLRETYFLPAQHLIDFYCVDDGKKSMPLDYIKKNGYLVANSAFPQVPYLDIIEKNFRR
ncbi:Holliday junction resolvase RecU [Streptococcus cuniculipharyngis]|uniref:Holliday junction resolvase RecU n=1 Tax=Streptococcus cuniculipharyngis TaxID=1562651 RepID=A0A5C5SE84_9STRE|nr:Holliday junction resolvase RecU [Streptococcus cuniculipharyngis]